MVLFPIYPLYMYFSFLDIKKLNFVVKKEKLDGFHSKQS